MISYKSELARRYFIFMIGIAMGALGVALYAKAALGVNSVACASYVFSYYFPITMGMVSIILYGSMMIIQYFLYPKDQKKKALINLVLQVPAIIVFGLLVDLALFLTDDFVPQEIGYWCCLLTCIASCAIIGVDIAMQTRADVVMLPSDGMVVLFARSRNYRIGTIKLIFDLTFVTIAVVVSLWQSNMSEITGVREGSIIGSLITGPVAQLMLPRFAFLDGFFARGK